MANNILPFAPTDTGTNLLTQVEYAAAADRTIGNQPGVASSKLVNKAIRQSAFMASQLAQYIADKISGSVLDDANTAALLAQFNSAFAPNDSFSIENLTLATAVGSSALTISVKTQAGANPSITDQIFVGMRNATLTSGTFNRRNLQSALSIVISSGSTLGQSSAQPSQIYVYLIDNAGTLELAVSHASYPEDALVTTTAEGGAGAADSATAIYSTTARANVALRLIGTLTNTQATAGTWATAPSQIQLYPSRAGGPPTVQKFTSGSGTYYVPAGCKYIRVRMVGGGSGGAGSSNASGNGGTGGTGGNSTFGTTLLVANGGAGPITSGPGSGGSASLGTGPMGVAVGGGSGAGVYSGTGLNAFPAGGIGAGSPFGGNGYGGPPNGAGGAAATNSGSGGGGAGGPNPGLGGGGGSAGGFVDAIIDCKNSAWASSFAYAVGVAGTAGTAGSAGFAGGTGGAGLILVEEHYV